MTLPLAQLWRRRSLPPPEFQGPCMVSEEFSSFSISSGNCHMESEDGFSSFENFRIGLKSSVI